MNIIETNIPDLKVIEPKLYGDHRGWFVETWQAQKYDFCPSFVQDNMSYSTKGILRGLHIQTPAQGKLVQVIEGKVFDVVVDLRKGSSFGQWFGLELSGDNKRQLCIPEGFAHGFYTMSQYAIFAYKCTQYYNPKGEKTLAWDDSTVGIVWPLDGNPIVSEKDAKGWSLSDFR